MNNLYTTLATVYEAMYHSFINYEEEYQFYSKVIKRYGKTEVVEIGCGTGNLVNHFMKAGFNYIGLDMSQDMINLAKEKTPTAQFIKDDMRSFTLPKAVESTIITARTISYLLTNEDVNNTFHSISNNLQKGGILSFDIIDANKFIPMVAGEKEIVHTAIANQTTYIRKSKWKLQLINGMDFLWNAIYYKKDKQKLIEIGQDHSTVRAFTVNEIEIFLSINGFKTLEIIERPSYFFPTYVFITKKI